MSYILVVGAGFSGAVIARELAEAGYRVWVIDKRDHIAGNAYDYVNKHGIRIHKYGPHLFHTNQKHVWEWVSQFCEWVPYKHRVKALLDTGELVTLPVNKETAEIVGKENIINTFYRPYSEKMWAMPLEQIDKSIIDRVKIRDDYNEYYFPNDVFQGLPNEGYTNLISNILHHHNIDISLNFTFHSKAPFYSEADHIFNSMPIDQYFDYAYGRLDYRSIKFHTFDIHHHLCEHFNDQPPVINFTDKGPYTRVTDWSLLPNSNQHRLYRTLTYEEPCDYRDNDMERYYPVKDVDGLNRSIYLKYRELAKYIDKMTFIGRCGLYTYIDMDMAISLALNISKKFIDENRNS